MKRQKITKRLCSLLLSLVAFSMIIAICAQNTPVNASVIKLFDGKLNTNKEAYFDNSVIYALPDSVKQTDDLSIIIQMNEDSLLDAYESSGSSMTFSQFAFSSQADKVRDAIDEKKADIISKLDSTNVSYTLGADYDTLISGFEIVITASDFETVCRSFGNEARAIVSEVYLPAETQLVENKVDVYDTGIFDSSDFPYDGTGMVVAVLDTGLDYYHTAFSLQNFTADRSKLGLTFDEVSKLVGDTRASTMQSGLTASDVYINEKVPFAFDYADEDSEVFPIKNNHGTHVSGIIAGKDDTITGVAPNAQLVEMKIFSDLKDSARASWILAALEDCAILGVDVINMSIGTACGFSRESDKEAMSGVYDRLREMGTSLVVAASNSYSSAYGSEKNGNLGLTSNPDTSTVGSPSTYEGALSVASINGAKTPYILYKNTIIYFTEANDRVSEEKHFVDELLPEGVDELEIEYITIPGAGRSADYTGIDVAGKIVLVSRGSTTFEEKANVAQEKGAAGVIIYNNVSGDIKMNVGDTTIPVCSISQDNGELLAEAGTGKIKVSRSQSSGPFMSDFSSWGPTPDLGIKPEITAHGGSILSAVPGQSYDRISGTSMACPNMAGVIALLRQYVVENFPAIKNDPVEVNNLVNRLLMSTADIVINTNGLPYSVRKQGAGLASLVSSAQTTAYIMTYNRTDSALMGKTKIELGDDPTKSGIYNLKFSVNNFGSTELTYKLGSYVMTEGVSETKTNDGETTVTEQGYILDGAVVEITSSNNCKVSDGKITVSAGQVADITVTITLSDKDKKYLNDSFENGMYVEGFIMLDAVSGTEIDLSVPYLGFYGDWTKAPIFDLDYYDTNKDELDDSIDLLDKTLADAYATRPIGGLSDDYVSYLGSYYYEQDPATKQISADRKYISLSNQADAVNSLRFVWAGLLRNCSTVVITITEDSTGEVVYQNTETDIRKSYGDGGSIYPANIDVEFSAIENNLKNNTKYTVNLKGYLDYGDGGGETNLKNEFEFPLVTDFHAPVISDCEFYTEYDRTEKKTRLFAKMAVYDNHYAMALQVGYVGLNEEGFMLNTFDKYLTTVYSEFNDTTYVVYELTDYIDQIKENAYNKNCFTVACYDYALNTSTYEISLPDEYLDFYFEQDTLTLSPNEVFELTPLVYPASQWPELLEFSSANENVAKVVNNKLVAIAPGVSRIIARDPVSRKTATMTLKVLAEGEEGFSKYDKPVLDKFTVDGYITNKAYYYLASTDRDIGLTGDNRKFASENSLSLKMFPSESVTINYSLDAYFPETTNVVFESSNSNIVTVDSDGRITAVSEGYATISLKVMMDGKSTFYSKSISIEVKDPYITTGPSLTHYFGNGGVVVIPETLAITEIGQYAFSNFDYIPKDENDEISEEEPDATKIWFIGDDTISEIVIPEGIKTIGPYAFANLTALTKVTLPSTLEKIDQGAFYGCTSLTTVVGLENVKFINQEAFANCDLKGTINLDKAVAISDYSFAFNEDVEKLMLSKDTQSLGAYAFAGNTKLSTVSIAADKLKLGAGVFMGCTSLTQISINASVIPTSSFDGCTSLEKVTIGKDVAVIGEFAFRGTKITEFTVASGNSTYTAQSSKPYLLSKDGKTLLLVAPGIKGEFAIDGGNVTVIGYAAFSGCSGITSVSLPNVTILEDYAFGDCTKLTSVVLGKLEHIGDYAFSNTSITEAPSFDNLTTIGKYSFADTKITSVVIPDNFVIGEGAFYECEYLESVVIGDGVVIGDHAFRFESLYHWETDSYRDSNNNKVYYYIYTSPLHKLVIGDNVTIGEAAFYGAAELESVTLGDNARIEDYAFFNAAMLSTIDLSKVISIGAHAFTGDVLYEYSNSGLTSPTLSPDGYYVYRYYSPAFTSIDISSLESIGNDAFSYCRYLKSVKFGSKLTSIASQTFMGCDVLESANLSYVVNVGENAFAECALLNVDLGKAENIGKYAFVYNEELTSVALNAAGTRIEEGAFAYCDLLESISNMGYVTYVGDYSFAYTALTEADLSSAEYIGTHAFFKYELTDFDLTIADKLTETGDNPFAFCKIKKFSGTTVESFNGKDYESITYTYDINDSIKVIDGSLYRVVPNGLELIVYSGDSKVVHVADNTVRISALAFAGSDITQVVLPSTLKAIGHKAFYDCDKLSLVTFTSYNAPILEEEYDYEYFISGQNIPATGEYSFASPDGLTTVEYPGLEIVPYFMWNAADTPYALFYGANFVDYIGHIDNKITMVRPVNGLNYGSFIFGQYFDSVIDGAAVADAITQAAIDAINRIPDQVTLADKATVNAAREAYNKIATTLQQSLVYNIEKLKEAEKRILALESLEEGEPPAEPPVDQTTNKLAASTIAIIVLSIILGITLIFAVVITILFIIMIKGKKDKKGPGAPTPAASAPASPSPKTEENINSEASADSDTESADAADNSSSSVTEENPKDGADIISDTDEPSSSETV